MDFLHSSNMTTILDSEPTFTIGVAARKAGVAVPTLRLYEKEGLICPFRTSTKRRLYSVNDLRIVETVRHLVHEGGLNFAGIRRLMAFLPCWSNGEAAWPKCRDNCQACPVYEMASQIGELSIYDFMRA